MRTKNSLLICNNFLSYFRCPPKTKATSTFTGQYNNRCMCVFVVLEVNASPLFLLFQIDVVIYFLKFQFNFLGRSTHSVTIKLHSPSYKVLPDDWVAHKYNNRMANTEFGGMQNRKHRNEIKVIISISFCYYIVAFFHFGFSFTSFV